MRVHHLNCISTCPLGGALMDGMTRGLRGRLSCHCLLVETDEGLVLVDTGFGVEDVRHPRPRLSRFFLALLRPELHEEMTALRQIEGLGFRGRDVRHIVLTHLDFDHAGGLDDFPDASVHMLALEQRDAEAQRSLLDRMRYRPQQWASSRPRWHVYGVNVGESWFGFEAVRELHGVPGEIFLVPLLGHTLGHAGIAVRAPEGWLLNAGDAYFFHGEMDLEEPRCTPGLRAYQRMMEKDRRLRLENQTRLRHLKRHHGNEVTIFSGHDVTELERLSGRSAMRALNAEVPTPELELRQGTT